jgi:large subunit ribosomal protein L33
MPGEIVTMKSSESAHFYMTRKNKKQNPDRLERKKYDPTLRKHVAYKEKK